jgi:hypothetical protein
MLKTSVISCVHGNIVGLRPWGRIKRNGRAFMEKFENIWNHMNIVETISKFLVIYFPAFSILAVVSYNLFDIINGALFF